MGNYRRVLAIPAVWRILLLGVMLRMPVAAAGVLIPLHVVRALGHSYTAAGLVAAVTMVCLGISGPCCGHLLDHYGLRRVVLPSLLITALCWSIAPFASYLTLTVLAGVAALFTVPVFTVGRQGLIAATAPAQRRASLALDAVGTEVSFIAGPLLGVGAASVWPTAWVLTATFGMSVVAGAALWLMNPQLRVEGAAAAGLAGQRCSWMAPLLVLCLMVSVGILVGSGTEMGTIAGMRGHGADELIGVGMALWCAGSLAGGLAYGALRWSAPTHVQLGLLSLVTLPVAFASTVPSLCLLLFAAGLMWSPVITASLEQLSALVPERFRGEALGWHGSFLSIGNAAGPPVAGFAADHGGPSSAFALVAVIGLVGALAGGGAMFLLGSSGLSRTADAGASR